MYIVVKTTILHLVKGLHRFQDKGICLKGMDNVLYDWLNDTEQPNVIAPRSATNVARGIINQFVSRPRKGKNTAISHQTVQIQI